MVYSQTIHGWAVDGIFGIFSGRSAFLEWQTSTRDRKEGFTTARKTLDFHAGQHAASVSQQDHKQESQNSISEKSPRVACIDEKGE